MSAPRRSRFATTQWSLVVAASETEMPAARGALADLCEVYWYPLYAFARRSGADPDTARDQTQGFFAELIDKNVVGQADRQRGRFRTFLIAAFRHHRGHERQKANAAKRGAGELPLSQDLAAAERWYDSEPQETVTPESLYERRWALTLLERVLESLREEYEAAGRHALFRELEPLLVGASTAGPYREIGERLGMSEAAIKVAAHRLKQRYAARLREAIAATVARPEEVDEELRFLIAAVR